MTKPRDFDSLKQMVASGDIDTVLVCFVDMQGRLVGKRFHAVNFVETSFKETHCCNYLLATDLEMATPPGYASTSWEKRLWRLHHGPRPEYNPPCALA